MPRVFFHMLQVILGGGRRSFIPKDELDPEAGVNSYQGRLDGRNLINVSNDFFIIGPQSNKTSLPGFLLN